MTTKTLPRSFEELITHSDLPVLVDFWAEWCGPCRVVSPTISRLARENAGRLLTVKVNVDRKPHIAAKYNIRSIPTIMLFWKGHELMRLTGAHSYEQLKRDIESHLPMAN